MDEIIVLNFGKKILDWPARTMLKFGVCSKFVQNWSNGFFSKSIDIFQIPTHNWYFADDDHITRVVMLVLGNVWVIPLLLSSCVYVGFFVYVSVLVFVSICCLFLSVSLCDPDSVCPCPSIIISECVFVSLSCVSLGLCPYVFLWASGYVAVWFLNAEISRLCKSRIKGSGFKTAWKNVIRLLDPDTGKPWEPGKYSYICFVYFHTGKTTTDKNHPDYVPSLYLGYGNKVDETTSRPTDSHTHPP